MLQESKESTKILGLIRFPIIKGVIDRRILINYQVDKEVLSAYIPEPFYPKLVKGKGIAGVCLIRLKRIRPKGFPDFIGISSENAAHRIAVEWEESGVVKEGVYIPRRDTSSMLNALVGGRLFPGVHHLSKFDVQESGNSYDVTVRCSDHTHLSIRARSTNRWNPDSVFEDINEVSNFFKNGSVGYSPFNGSFEGLELRSYNWKVSLLEVEGVESSFFDDLNIFPLGAVKFDNALLMKEIRHEWIGLERMLCGI